MRQFYNLLVNTLIANITTSFLWFCLTFWVYLETKSVFATAIIGGSYMLFISIMGIPFGTFIDRHKKKYVMQVATAFAVGAFALAGLLYAVVDKASLLDLTSPWFWLFIIAILAGSVVESARSIALSTCVTIMVPKERRDKANGMVGAVTGVSFLITSVFSGLAIGFFGMGWALLLAVVLMATALLHLQTITINEDHLQHDPELTKQIDVKGAITAIKTVPGLPALIFFTTFNNLLGGVFMAVMDPYGLSLMSVQVWGILWGVLSTGFIAGGILVATKGLGARPLRTLLLVNVIMWSICIFFPSKSIIPFLAIGMFVYMCLVPIVEAVEQTVIQRVVPLNKQGRVFGFAQTIETASTPIMAFLIGPLAEFVIMPAMREGGQLNTLIGSWFGTGDVRALALVMILAGIVGLIMTLYALRSRSYGILSASYQQAD